MSGVAVLERSPLGSNHLGYHEESWQDPKFQAWAILNATTPGGALFPDHTTTPQEVEFANRIYDAIGLDTGSAEKVARAVDSLDRENTPDPRLLLTPAENAQWKAKVIRRNLQTIQSVHEASPTALTRLMAVYRIRHFHRYAPARLVRQAVVRPAADVLSMAASLDPTNLLGTVDAALGPLALQEVIYTEATTSAEATRTALEAGGIHGPAALGVVSGHGNPFRGIKLDHPQGKEFGEYLDPADMAPWRNNVIRPTGLFILNSCLQGSGGSYGETSPGAYYAMNLEVDTLTTPTISGGIVEVDGNLKLRGPVFGERHARVFRFERAGLIINPPRGPYPGYRTNPLVPSI